MTRDADFDSLSLDPQAPGTWQDRIVALTALQDAARTNPSALRARGGEILMAHGAHDALVSNRATQQYWQRLRSAKGATTVDSLMRSDEFPGCGHAASSVFDAAWDSLTALENWVGAGRRAAAARGGRHRRRAGPHAPAVPVPGLAAVHGHRRRRPGAELPLRHRMAPARPGPWRAGRATRRHPAAHRPGHRAAV